MNPFKHCPDCDTPKDHNQFGPDGRTEDGFTRTCLTCRSIAKKSGTLRRSATKQSNLVSQSALVEFVVPIISQGLIKRVTPLYQYLIALDEKANILSMPKNISEIVAFFGFKPRVGIDLIHEYIKRIDDGYEWTLKPKSAKEVAKAYAKLINLKDAPPHVTEDVLYEQFILMREELAEMNAHFSKLVTALE